MQCRSGGANKFMAGPSYRRSFSDVIIDALIRMELTLFDDVITRRSLWKRHQRHS